MARQKRYRASRWWLAVRQRSATSWTSWSLKRTLRKQKRAEIRLQLLQLETDSQLLRVKELSQRQTQLEHRRQEQLESREYRLHQQLPE